MEVKKFKQFGNGAVYALVTSDGKIVETTDTFLPYYTIQAVGRRTNSLINPEYGSRKDRWMIGVSVSSGCPVGCKFCATGSKFYGHLTAEEMLEQINFIVDKNNISPNDSRQFKILFTRMGEPALNYEELCKAIEIVKQKYPFAAIGLSTIGIRNPALLRWLELSKKYSDIQLQFSLHTTSAEQRDDIIPLKNKLSFEDIREFGKKWTEVENNKRRKITLNFTILEDNEFSVQKLKSLFSEEHFFIKLSPLNENDITRKNNLKGLIKERNIG